MNVKLNDEQNKTKNMKFEFCLFYEYIIIILFKKKNNNVI